MMVLQVQYVRTLFDRNPAVCPSIMKKRQLFIRHRVEVSDVAREWYMPTVDKELGGVSNRREKDG